jgi:hypothetical protein
LSGFFSLGFGWLGWRGDGQNLLQGVLKFDAVQAEVFGGFWHGKMSVSQSLRFWKKIQPKHIQTIPKPRTPYAIIAEISKF